MAANAIAVLWDAHAQEPGKSFAPGAHPASVLSAAAVSPAACSHEVLAAVPSDLLQVKLRVGEAGGLRPAVTIVNATARAVRPPTLN